MATTNNKSFIKQHLLPSLLVFILPVFSAWFFSYAPHSYDRDLLDSIQKDITKSVRMDAETKKATLRFFMVHPVSEILSSSDSKVACAAHMFSDVANAYRIFDWMKHLAWACLAAIGLTYLFVGVSVSRAFRSQEALYRSLRLGWSVLRVTVAAQVIGQGVLMCFLPYWASIVWFSDYSFKVVLATNVLAILAVGLFIRSIFTRVEAPLEIEGEVLTESTAPDLHNRVRILAEQMGTAPPDHIIAGIEPSFFVTEHSVTHRGHVLKGRTLYLSLPMLKIMTVDEADAVLSHELAHFSGGDTFWSLRISPLMERFSTYLSNLNVGHLTPIGSFLQTFWKLYMLAIGRHSRERELRADKMGADKTSPSSMCRALIKVGGYCEFRSEFEAGIVKQNKVDKELQLAAQLERGFPGFLKQFVEDKDSLKNEIPHPFDSHPPLIRRLESLKVTPQAAMCDPQLQHPVQQSWYWAIHNVGDLESAMWNKRQQAIQNLQGQNIAWKTVPSTEDELAQVREHFPDCNFKHKAKGWTAALGYDRIEFSNLNHPILFDKIDRLERDSDMFSGKNRLKVFYKEPVRNKGKRHYFYPVDFVGAESNGPLMDAFLRYYSRHISAKQSASKAA